MTAPVPVRRGMTLLELIMVLLVMMILVMMSAGPVMRSLRHAKVDRSAGAVVTASTHALLLARRSNGAAGTVYGVRLQDDPDLGDPYVAVIEWDGSATTIATDAAGEPLYRYDFPSAAMIWEGGQPLSENSKTLEWYYRPGSGRVMIDPADPNRVGAVGLPDIEVTDAFGLDWNDVDTTRGLFLATGMYSEGEPGLSIRDPFQEHQVSVGVYPVGVAFSRQLGEDEE